MVNLRMVKNSDVAGVVDPSKYCVFCIISCSHFFRIRYLKVSPSGDVYSLTFYCLMKSNTLCVIFLKEQVVALLKA